MNWPNFKLVLWRWILRQFRAIVWTADEWIHAQEVQLRETAEVAAPAGLSDEFNVAKSAAREKVHKAKRAARPRLRYQGGQFVRSA